MLLQKLIRAKSLREYTHIIIDEVHERNQDLDFLLLIVRKFLFTNSPGTKVSCLLYYSQIFVYSFNLFAGYSDVRNHKRE